MSEVDKVRAAAVDRARQRLIVRAHAVPVAVTLGERVRFVAEFFSRNVYNPSQLESAAPQEPVVETLGDLAEEESRLQSLQPRGDGKYECQLVPRRSGTRAYRVKEKKELTGKLIEVEVLDKDADKQLKDFFHNFGFDEEFGEE